MYSQPGSTLFVASDNRLPCMLAKRSIIMLLLATSNLYVCFSCLAPHSLSNSYAILEGLPSPVLFGGLDEWMSGLQHEVHTHQSPLFHSSRAAVVFESSTGQQPRLPSFQQLTTTRHKSLIKCRTTTQATTSLGAASERGRKQWQIRPKMPSRTLSPFRHILSDYVKSRLLLLPLRPHCHPK